jgi:hypothetical protein
VEAYIGEDVLDPEQLASPPSRAPTASEIAEILAPWRPQKLRRIAAAHLGQVGVAGFTRQAKWDIHFYILRTHYGGGAADDARLRSWLDQGSEGPEIEPEDEWFTVLNDAKLFDFGDYWQEVYDVFPSWPHQNRIAGSPSGMSSGRRPGPSPQSRMTPISTSPRMNTTRMGLGKLRPLAGRRG